MGRTLALTSPLTQGDDVVFSQECLQGRRGPYAAFYKGARHGIYDEATADAAKKAKYYLGFPLPEVDRTCGDTLRGLLQHGPEALPEDYQVRRTARLKAPSVPPVPPAAALRADIVGKARWGVAHEPQIHYAQVRPMPASLALALEHPIDCSAFVTLCYKDAGAPDPNGLAYNGSGYTGTLLGHCRHISSTQAQAADLVVFGSGTGTHVVLITETGSDPLVASHGWDGGPQELRLSTESHYHAGEPITFLACLP